jgi:hypothetical protein
MLKKMFVISLVLVLALSMGLQAAPVLAQGGDSDPGAGFQSVVPAEIKNVTLLNGLPPRIQINGTLPASCYQLHVSAPVVGEPNSTSSITPITIRVLGVWLPGTLCNEMLKHFSTTVAIDPFKLKLTPGRYLVQFNPVNGQTQHEIWISIPARSNIE